MNSLSDDDEKWVTEMLNKMSVFMERKTEDCIFCGRRVTRLEKIGRCVYARPCGCRMWQGNVPDAWKHPAEKLF